MTQLLPDNASEWLVELVESGLDPRGIETLHTEFPQCRSEYGGLTSGHDHDHRCDWDVDLNDPEGRCSEFVRFPDGTTGVQIRFHDCEQCEQGWSTGARSTKLDGTEIVA